MPTRPWIPAVTHGHSTGVQSIVVAAGAPLGNQLLDESLHLGDRILQPGEPASGFDERVGCRRLCGRHGGRQGRCGKRRSSQRKTAIESLTRPSAAASVRIR